MLITVIIPVYNAACYLEQSIKSVLIQPEVAEILLVEDGSTDDSLALCNRYAEEYDSVCVLQHPNGINKGAAASRNLGILNAKHEMIAFLDADDYYAANRFAFASSILESDPTVDGVYEVIGMHYENETARLEWQERHPESYESGIFTAIERTPSDELFEKYLHRGHLFFSGNALTIRKSALLRVGMYSETRVQEDIILCYKLASKCKLVAGNLETPSSFYRIHGENSSSYVGKPYEAERRDMIVWRTLWEWSIEHLDTYSQRAFMQRYVRAFLNRYKHETWLRRNTLRIADCLDILFHHPHLILQKYFRQTIYRRR